MKMKGNGEVIRSELGFYEILNKPDEESLARYYSAKYFSESESYGVAQNDFEISYKQHFAKLVLHFMSHVTGAEVSNIFEIGFGEGFLLEAAMKSGIAVGGADFSISQVLSCNEGIIPYVRKSSSPLRELLTKSRCPQFINMQHVLEHVIDPMGSLSQIVDFMDLGSFLVIEVPSDFSSFQTYLLSEGYVDSEYWVSPPDHLNYFTLPSLKSACVSAGLTFLGAMGDFPVQAFLLADSFNYRRHPDRGRSAHEVRCRFFNYQMENLSLDHVMESYQTESALLMARSITGIFRK